MADIDENISILHKGSAARAVRQYTEDTFFKMEDEIIDTLIRLYHQDTLTDTRARGMIGELARIRKCSEVLEVDIQRGVAAAEKELGNG